MILVFRTIIPIFLIACGIAALQVKDLFACVIILAAYSFLICLLWAELGAIDVAFTEAAVGAGVSTVILIAALLHTTRRSRD
ncbi:MAG: DUF4040 domain-containing protein [Candidatus Dadabacteria bacterium]|nr:MAG: DUF4040 domain-containing protein [Candidatus Dadabacteria bacterium]